MRERERGGTKCTLTTTVKEVKKRRSNIKIKRSLSRKKSEYYELE